MRYLDATFSHLLYDYLYSKGIDATQLLGPMPAVGTRLSEKRWQQMLESGARAHPEPAFGLSVAECFSLRHLGVVGYLLRSCSTALEALQRGQQYHLLVSEKNPVEVHLEGNELQLSWPLKHGFSGQLWDEVGLGTVYKLMQSLSDQPVKVSRVDFVAPSPGNTRAYRMFFGGDIYFNQPMPRLCIPIGDLSNAMPAPDPDLLRILTAQAEEKLQATLPFQDELQAYRKQLIQLIHEGCPTLAALAECNKVGTRTLQRRLTKHQTSFQKLLDSTRFQLAQRYLADSRLSLTDVVELLGYNEQSTFCRAFAKWSGTSPMQWRRSHSQPASAAREAS